MSTTTINWKPYTLVSIVTLFVFTVIAAFTHLWVLTAIPIGFLFGFFLQKGDLCGASAFSEIILMKDWQKMFGLWIAIVVSMIGFTVIDLLGLVNLNPKHMFWMNQVVGGVLFGIGMVLAGGCISGCLFKAGSGNLNSMIALLGIPLGISMVKDGPLHSFFIYMKTFVIKSYDGSSVTLSSLTNLPFWSLALFFGIVTLALVLFFNDRKSKQPITHDSGKNFLIRSWKPWQAGLAIGLLSIVAYMSSAASGRNYALGVTGGVLQSYYLMTEQNLKHVWHKPVQLKPTINSNKANLKNPQTMNSKPAPKKKPVVWWLVALVCALVMGSWISAKLSGKARLLPRPPEQIIVALLGGILIGIGAAFAMGCVIGNILSGWAMMSVGTILFGITAILSNWAATYFYLMGGSLFDR
ncbi:YeeE/YedE family protein [Candidatus Magnetomoraceae bacterium gMMP-15]